MNAPRCRYCGNAPDSELQGDFAGAGKPLRNVECRNGRACERRRVRKVIAEVRARWLGADADTAVDEITKALQKRKP